MEYSNRFRQLVENKPYCSQLIEGCGAVGVDFSHWTKMRGFIAKTINRDGTILDIGCGSGFLLFCIQEWARHSIIPYGIDKDESLIREAKKYMSKNNFAAYTIDWDKRLDPLKGLEKFNIPSRYTFVYWNVWDMLTFDRKSELYKYERALFESVFELVENGGRLILGFYDSDRNKKQKIRNLEGCGYGFNGVLENYSVRSDEPVEIAAWIDKC